MPDTTLRLGGVSFRDFEIPDEIHAGGKQMLNVHKLVGGERVIDAMGPDPDDITWHGRFRGQDAASRCQTLDAMRAQGAQVELSWGGFYYLVVIETFNFSYQRFYEIEYSICLKVVEDPASQGAGSGSFGSLFGGLGALLGADLASVSDILGGMPDAVSGAIGGLQSAIGAAGDLADATFGTLSPLITQAGGALDTINGTLATLDAGITGDPTGGAEQVAASILSQLSATSQEATLRTIGSYVGRIGLNLQLAA